MLSNSNIQDIYPLAPLQAGMLFHSLYDHGNVDYVEQIAYRLMGKLNIENVQKSLNELFKRHDVLRTVFNYTKKIEQPLQVVLKHREIDFCYKDLRSMRSNEEKEAFVREFKLSDRRRSFDLTKDVLMRVGILRLSDEEHEFIWSHHHILMDGWCMGILTSEYREIYDSFERGTEYRLPPAAPYRNFIRWLLQQDQTAAANYWKSYLQEYDTAAVIPRKTAAGLGTDRTAKELVFEIGQEKTGKLNVLASGRRVTLNTMVETLWGILLSRYNNTSDVVFGKVVSGRPSSLPGVETMVGLFINTVPVRVKYHDRLAFRDLLVQMQEHSLAAASYHYYSLPDIQRATVLNNRLFDHIIVFENYPVLQHIATGERNSRNGRPGPEVRDIELFEQSSYAFNILVFPGESLVIKLRYYPGIWSDGFAERVPGHFQELIDQILAAPDMAIEDLSIITAKEREQLLVSFNDTAVHLPVRQTIVDLFSEQVFRAPGAVAAIFGSSQLTYEELDERSCRLANYLRARGVREESLVAICMERSLEMLIAILGILKAGGAYVPVDPAYPELRIRYILEDAGASIILGSSTCRERMAAFGTGSGTEEWIELDTAWSDINQEDPAGPVTELQPGHLAYLMYTSGSTGRPKGVMIEHKGVVNLVHSQTIPLDLHPGIVVFQFSSLSFDASCYEIFNTLLVGGTLILASRQAILDPTALIKLLNKHRVELITLPPSYQSVLEEGADWLRTVVSAGEKLDVNHAMAIQNKGIRLINAYGPTENTVCALLSESPLHESGAVTIGRPIGNVRAYLLDRGLRPVPVGIVGELYLAGDGVARGYWGQPDLTKKRFMPDPFTGNGHMYRTGDLARWLEDGNVEYAGRSDDQVKISGFRIEPGEVEAALQQCRFVRQAAVIVQEERGGYPVLIGYIQPVGDLKRESILEYLKTCLPEYMIPSQLIELKTMPITVNGKIDRISLAALDTRQHRTRNYLAPRNEAEEKLVTIWQQVLGIERIGITDNFFELGGHSIKAVRMAGSVSKVFAKQILMKDIFNNPTIFELRELLDLPDQDIPGHIPLIAEAEDYELSYAQKRLWIIDQLEGEKTAYNIFGSYVFEGELDRGALERSFGEVVDRHESLRTVFVSREGEPRQKILSREELGYRLKYVDLREEEEGEQRARELSEEESVRGFDLTRGPLLRTKLLRMGERRYVFLMTLHHIISDGWSMEVMVRELLGLYEGYSRGEERELKGLRIQYKDYAAWQNGLLGGEEVSSHRKYWREQLGGELPVLELPTDYKRKGSDIDNGDFIETELNKELVLRILGISAKYETSIFTFLFAAVNILLYRYSGQKDIITGVATTGRSHKDTADLIGFFINILPIRLTIDPAACFSDFLEAVKARVTETYDHESFPYLVIKDELERTKPLRGDIFKVMFQLDYASSPGTGEDMEFKKITVDSFGQVNRTSKYDLTFFFLFEELKKDISLRIEYSTDLFKVATIRKMSDDLLVMMGKLLFDGNLLLSARNLIDYNEEIIMNEFMKPVNEIV